MIDLKILDIDFKDLIVDFEILSAIFKFKLSSNFGF